ncbi:MAG: preprotein translocase subunit YajC [Halobacteriovoraceae bacterium]|nr:preprotein translocase subunit YajC [Halobacteriovoraceae bacterium]MBG59263.1 preprotein translocase subunit YajC [Peredibacter sp.]|tara:strand:+ start:39275 stop:39613 length:339 start_codon:yes stop_codon:yes gene_type:complete
MLDLFIASAHAQAGAPQQNPIMSFVPIILVFLVLYFLMIRPQKKKMEEEQRFISQMQKGEEVFTKSGMIGTIYGLTDKVVTLEIEGGQKVKFLRNQIGGSTKILNESPEAKK